MVSAVEWLRSDVCTGELWAIESNLSLLRFDRALNQWRKVSINANSIAISTRFLEQMEGYAKYISVADKDHIAMLTVQGEIKLWVSAIASQQI